MKPASLAGLVASCVLCGCSMPGKPAPGPAVPRPESVTAFTTLYAQNCAGCHGADGQNGAATSLANPVYQALVDDATLRNSIANGGPGALMPPFGEKAGGMLSDQQIDSLVQGIRSRWFKGNVLAGQNPPAYTSTAAGDPARGAELYQSNCARCHGPSREQPGQFGSILDGSFLALIPDQTIRTTIIAGRPDLRMPDWRNQIPGHPLSEQNVTDTVAWLRSQRQSTPGQPYPATQPSSQGGTSLNTRNDSNQKGGR